MTNTISVTSPVGNLTIEGTDEAITYITLPGTPERADHLPEASGSGQTNDDRSQGKAFAAGGTAEVLRAAADQLEEYFSGKRTRFDLPVDLDGTPFQKEVWLALADIPYGETVSYAELANMVGRPNAYRAVGQANGANPVPIVLPCHRVVASGGGIGGYGGGLDLKRRLLAIEGVTAFA
jgi:methylated-DNA-[protein]-cysteine S-methyltransferase